MAAPKGNEFWKLRLKHGRSHAIETAEQLWENFLEYAQWINENPLIEIDYKGKDAIQVEMPKMRPFTKDGFALACGLSEWRIIDEWRDRKGFSQIITCIEKQIINQKFEGAASGFFNPNIIARDLGLTEKSEQQINIKGKPSWMDEDGSEQKS